MLKMQVGMSFVNYSMVHLQNILEAMHYGKYTVFSLGLCYTLRCRLPVRVDVCVSILSALRCFRLRAHTVKKTPKDFNVK